MRADHVAPAPALPHAAKSSLDDLVDPCPRRQPPSPRGASIGARALVPFCTRAQRVVAQHPSPNRAAGRAAPLPRPPPRRPPPLARAPSPLRRAIRVAELRVARRSHAAGRHRGASQSCAPPARVPKSLGELRRLEQREEQCERKKAEYQSEDAEVGRSSGRASSDRSMAASCAQNPWPRISTPLLHSHRGEFFLPPSARQHIAPVSRRIWSPGASTSTSPASPTCRLGRRAARDAARAVRSAGRLACCSSRSAPAACQWAPYSHRRRDGGGIVPHRTVWTRPSSPSLRLRTASGAALDAVYARLAARRGAGTRVRNRCPHQAGDGRHVYGAVAPGVPASLLARPAADVAAPTARVARRRLPGVHAAARAATGGRRARCGGAAAAAAGGTHAAVVNTSTPSAPWHRAPQVLGRARRGQDRYAPWLARPRASASARARFEEASALVASSGSRARTSSTACSLC